MCVSLVRRDLRSNDTTPLPTGETLHTAATVISRPAINNRIGPSALALADIPANERAKASKRYVAKRSKAHDQWKYRSPVHLEDAIEWWHNGCL